MAAPLQFSRNESYRQHRTVAADFDHGAEHVAVRRIRQMKRREPARNLVKAVGILEEACEEFGFETEGIQRRYVFRSGQYVDSYAMARLRPGWSVRQ